MDNETSPTGPDTPDGSPGRYGGDSDEIATIGSRIVARLIDWILLGAFWVVLGGSMSQTVDDAVVIPAWAVLTWMAVVLVYETAMVAWRGQTLGKMATGIKIVNAADGAKPNLWAAFARVAPVGLTMVLGRIFPIVMVFVYFSAAFMPSNRGILDKAASTAVVKR